MIRTQIYIPDDLHRDAMFLAHQEGTHFSAIVREGVRTEIQKRKLRGKKLRQAWGKGFIGAGKTMKRTDAVRDIHDYYLRNATR